jgi:hypothetical protein
MLARVLIWNLFESKTTLAELREHLPSLLPGDVWISNAAQEWFGLITLLDEPPDRRSVVGLIGGQPEVAEEFDVE